MLKETEENALCEEFAKGVRVYFPMKNKAEIETEIQDLCKKINHYNYVAEVRLENNEKEQKRRLTFIFLKPVPITSEVVLDDLLDCYFELFQDKASIVTVSAIDGSESECALWDLKNCVCK